jgi:hypothetical protein
MTTLYAQPYDLAATGFAFDSAGSYADQADRLRNAYGQPVEEFEIQFIDGATIDAELFSALRVSQTGIDAYFDAVDQWSDDQKVRAIIAVGEIGVRFELGKDDPDRLGVDLYEIDSLRDLAIQFVEDGLFGEIPEPIASYLDFDAIARDLAMDYGTTTVAGRRYAYRSG